MKNKYFTQEKSTISNKNTLKFKDSCNGIDAPRGHINYQDISEDIIINIHNQWRDGFGNIVHEWNDSVYPIRVYSPTYYGHQCEGRANNFNELQEIVEEYRDNLYEG